MKALIRGTLAAAVFAGLVGITAPAAAQSASVDIRIGTPGYHYRPYYRHGHRAHIHSQRAYARHYRRPVVVVVPRAYYRHGAQHRAHRKHYLRWY